MFQSVLNIFDRKGDSRTTTRVNFRVSEAINERLENLRRLTKAATKTDVFKRGMALYELVVECLVNEGADLLLAFPDGRLHRVHVLEDHPPVEFTVLKDLCAIAEAAEDPATPWVAPINRSVVVDAILLAEKTHGHENQKRLYLNVLDFTDFRKWSPSEDLRWERKELVFGCTHRGVFQEDVTILTSKMIPAGRAYVCSGHQVALVLDIVR